MRTSLQRLRALIYKETVQILRDRRTLMLFFLLPLIQLFLFAYAVSLTVNHLPTALVDQSMDARSRDFVHALESSAYFDVKAIYQNEQEVVRAIDAGQMKAGIIIPPDFVGQGGTGPGQRADPAGRLRFVQRPIRLQCGQRDRPKICPRSDAPRKCRRAVRGEEVSPLTPVTRVLYNPDIKDLIFILPGLIALIMQNIIVAHSAVAVVREREVGTLEQLLATPMRPIEMIIAKLIPGLVVVMIDMAFILGLGVFWFGVPFQGSLPTYCWAFPAVFHLRRWAWGC